MGGYRLITCCLGALPLFGLPAALAAQCFTIDQIKGYSNRQGEGYSISADSIARTIDVTLDGTRSRIGGDERMQCTQPAPLEVVCAATPEAGQYIVDAWLLDLETKVATHSRLVAGAGLLDGGRLMTGRVVGQCLR